MRVSSRRAHIALAGLMIALAIVGALAFTLTSASATGSLVTRQASPFVSAVSAAEAAVARFFGPTTRALPQRQRPLGVSPLTDSAAGNGLGNEPFYTYYTVHLNDRKQLLVNVANGSGGWTDPPGLNATLTQNQDGAYSLTFHKTGEVYTFSSGGHLSRDTDKNGNTIEIQGSNGLVSEFTDTQGRAYTPVYDGNNRITSITDPTSRVAKYSYNSNNQLATTTDLADNVTTFGYDPSSGLLTSVKDPRFHSTTITYDSSGACSRSPTPRRSMGRPPSRMGRGPAAPAATTTPW